MAAQPEDEEEENDIIAERLLSHESGRSATFSGFSGRRTNKTGDRFAEFGDHLEQWDEDNDDQEFYSLLNKKTKTRLPTHQESGLLNMNFNNAGRQPALGSRRRPREA